MIIRLGHSPQNGDCYEKCKWQVRLGSHLSKRERIEQQKEQVGSRNHRKLKKYSKNFNTMFNFFLQSYRKGILTFSGSNIKVDFDENEGDGKFCFRKYDNGEYKFLTPKSKHPNILFGVITAKKSWGLWLDQFTDGINERLFTKEEILEQFKEHGIEIPGPLMKDFDNTLERKRLKRIDNDLQRWKETK